MNVTTSIYLKCIVTYSRMKTGQLLMCVGLKDNKLKAGSHNTDRNLQYQNPILQSVLCPLSTLVPLNMKVGRQRTADLTKQNLT